MQPTAGSNTVVGCRAAVLVGNGITKAIWRPYYNRACDWLEALLSANQAL